MLLVQNGYVKLKKTSNRIKNLGRTFSVVHWGIKSRFCQCKTRREILYFRVTGPWECNGNKYEQSWALQRALGGARPVQNRLLQRSDAQHQQEQSSRKRT